MNQLRVYLAGPISGRRFDEAELWRIEFKDIVNPHIECLSPLRALRHLREMGIIEQSYDDPLCSDRGILARDHFDCHRADLIVCNFLDVTRVSIGSVIECGFAFAYRKPLIIIQEEDNVHNHPMLRQMADYRVSSVNEAAELSLSILLP